MTKRILLACVLVGAASFLSAAGCATSREAEETEQDEGETSTSGASALAVLDRQGAYTPDDVELWCTARNEGEGQDERLTLPRGSNGPEGFYPCSRHDVQKVRSARSQTVVIPNQQVFTVTQKCNQWCWATGDQMVSKAMGIDRDQTFFVKKIFGSTTCSPASSLQQMSTALTGRYEDGASGAAGTKCSKVTASAHDGFPTNVDVLVASLQAGRPFLFAHSGHVWTAYGLSYEEMPAGKKLEQLELIDPWPSSPRYQTFRVGVTQFQSPGGTIRVDSLTACVP